MKTECWIGIQVTCLKILAFNFFRVDPDASGLIPDTEGLVQDYSYSSGLAMESCTIAISMKMLVIEFVGWWKM